jgi:uncharacterized membrane protein YbhN (UPF0104 family)
LNAVAFWIGFVAVGIHVPFAAALFTQGIIAISVAIPSSPGFFGVFEAAGKIALGMYGVSETLAVTWAVGFHLLSFIPITLIGAYYFARAGITFAELSKAGSAASESRDGGGRAAVRTPIEPPAA